MVKSPTMARTGSSPLTRGKHWRLSVDQFSERLIPAHAGKTLVRTHVTMRESAHPRSRGENLVTGLMPEEREGSSPLTRGKLPKSGQASDRLRLIPAHAGKTRFQLTLPGKASAHPRSRGENPCLFGRQGPLHGSSPLTRGKPSHSVRSFLTEWAHPRSRGENPLENAVDA